MVQINTSQRRVQQLRQRWLEVPDPAEGPRGYFLLDLDDGALCCVFRRTDLLKWYRQHISQKAWRERISIDESDHQTRPNTRP